MRLSAVCAFTAGFLIAAPAFAGAAIHSDHPMIYVGDDPWSSGATVLGVVSDLRADDAVRVSNLTARLTDSTGYAYPLGGWRTKDWERDPDPCHPPHRAGSVQLTREDRKVWSYFTASEPLPNGDYRLTITGYVDGAPVEVLTEAFALSVQTPRARNGTYLSWDPPRRAFTARPSDHAACR